MDTVGVRLLEAHISVKGDGRLLLAGLALAGGHEHDTVGGAGAVDGGGGGILKNINGFDVGRVEVIQVAAGNTVDDDERAGVAVGAETADGDVVAGTRHTAGLDDVHTRNGAVEGSERVGGAHLLDFLAGDVDRGTREESLLLGTVTDNDGFLEHFVVLLEDDVEDALIADLEGLALVADALDGDRGSCRNTERECAVQIGCGADACVTDHGYSRADDRLLVGINDCTTDRAVLGRGLETPP